MNLFLPGAGLFYVGQRKLGATLALTFLICLVTALGLFAAGYVHYLNVVLAGDLMQEGQIEQLTDVFHKRWLVGLGLAAIAIQLLSMVALSRAQKGKLTIGGGNGPPPIS